MKMNHDLPRRRFLKHMAAAVPTLAALSGVSVADSPPVIRYPLIGFSKAFQNLSFEDTADLVAEVGWNGIECPVRPGGHVLPERVEEDLPKMAEALQRKGVGYLHITTAITRADDPSAQRILKAASKLGVRVYRLGPMYYAKDRPLPEQIAEARARLKDLVALNRELGLCAGFQNHSGANYMGAPVWDIHEMIHDLDSKYMGICFDIGHATIEGGYAWALHNRLMEPHFCAVYVKDFTWSKGSQGWQAKLCPLGEGMVNADFFKRLKHTNFSGPISMHFEYECGQGQTMVKQFQRDLGVLKRWLTDL